MDLLALAKTIADRIELAAARAEVPVAVSVIDTHGNAILKIRMSGASAFSIELSERKAYTSALVGMRTVDLLPLVQYMPPICPGCGPNDAGPIADLLRLNTGIPPTPVEQQKRLGFLPQMREGIPGG